MIIHKLKIWWLVNLASFSTEVWSISSSTNQGRKGWEIQTYNFIYTNRSRIVIFFVYIKSGLFNIFIRNWIFVFESSRINDFKFSPRSWIESSEEFLISENHQNLLCGNFWVLLVIKILFITSNLWGIRIILMFSKRSEFSVWNKKGIKIQLVLVWYNHYWMDLGQEQE
jgi:hypothetical protein